MNFTAKLYVIALVLKKLAYGKGSHIKERMRGYPSLCGYPCCLHGHPPCSCAQLSLSLRAAILAAQSYPRSYPGHPNAQHFP